MSRLPLLYALWLSLVPLAVHAQDTPSAPTEPDTSIASPPLVNAPDEEAVPEPAAPALPDVQTQTPDSDPVVGRLFLGMISVGAGTLVGGVVGLLAGYLLDGDCTHNFDGGGSGDCALTIGTGLLGMVTGTATGAYATGSLLKGRGRFLGTFLGAALGTGAGLLLLPSVGAITGYELSRHTAATSFQAQEQQGPSLSPAFGVTPRGGFVGGLPGRF